MLEEEIALSTVKNISLREKYYKLDPLQIKIDCDLGKFLIFIIFWHQELM